MILSTPKMEAMFLWNVGSKSHIPEDGTLHSHRREKLKSYTLILDVYLQYKRQLLEVFVMMMPLAILHCSDSES
jgi:hypothetical protein